MAGPFPSVFIPAPRSLFAPYLKERFLSHRPLDDYDAIVDAACNAWNRLLAKTGRIRSLCSYPWIPAVSV
jgi:hypothetical protein